MRLRWGRIIEAKEYNNGLKNQFDYTITGVEAGEEVDEYDHFRDLKHRINKQDSKMDSIKWCIDQGLQKGKKVLVLTDTKEFTAQIGEEL
jgi:hypothetical protein